MGPTYGPQATYLTDRLPNVASREQLSIRFSDTDCWPAAAVGSVVPGPPPQTPQTLVLNTSFEINLFFFIFKELSINDLNWTQEKRFQTVLRSITCTCASQTLVDDVTPVLKQSGWAFFFFLKTLQHF